MGNQTDQNNENITIDNQKPHQEYDKDTKYDNSRSLSKAPSPFPSRDEYTIAGKEDSRNTIQKDSNHSEKIQENFQTNVPLSDNCSIAPSDNSEAEYNFRN